MIAVKRRQLSMCILKYTTEHKSDTKLYQTIRTDTKVYDRIVWYALIYFGTSIKRKLAFTDELRESRTSGQEIGFASLSAHFVSVCLLW